MNDIVFNVLPTQGPTIPMWVPILGGIQISAFFPPLVGSFLGVITAFILNYLFQTYSINKDRKKFKNMIRSEVKQCITILEQATVQKLPVDQWTSAVNSGALKLFDVEIELASLTKYYHRIQDYNNKTGDYIGAEWEKIKQGPSITQYPYDVNQAKQLQESREWLITGLKELEVVKWLNPASRQ